MNYRGVEGRAAYGHSSLLLNLTLPLSKQRIGLPLALSVAVCH